MIVINVRAGSGRAVVQGHTGPAGRRAKGEAMLTASEPVQASQELTQARQLLEWGELDACEQRMAGIARDVGADNLGPGARECWRQVRLKRISAEQRYSARFDPLPLFQRWPRAFRDACRLIEGSGELIAAGNIEWRTDRLLEELTGTPSPRASPETVEYVAGLMSQRRALDTVREKLESLVTLHDERAARWGT